MPRVRSRKKWDYLGYDFKSRIEHDTGKQLLGANIPFEYESKSFSYTIKVPTTFCGDCDSTNALSTRSYTPDFFLPNGIVIECKGRFTAAERKKHAAMKEQHPDLDLRILFQRDDWLTKAHKKKYSEWCASKGIKWASGFTLPKEWIDDCKRKRKKSKQTKTTEEE